MLQASTPHLAVQLGAAQLQWNPVVRGSPIGQQHWSNWGGSALDPRRLDGSGVVSSAGLSVPGLNQQTDLCIRW